MQVEGESKGETAVKEGMEAQWRRRVEREEKISVQQYLGAVNTTEQLGSRQLDNRSSSVQDTSSNNSVPPEMKTARGGVRTPQSLTRRRDRWFRGTASVSMVVWAEDASDELRADVGQVDTWCIEQEPLGLCHLVKWSFLVPLETKLPGSSPSTMSLKKTMLHTCYSINEGAHCAFGPSAVTPRNSRG